MFLLESQSRFISNVFLDTLLFIRKRRTVHLNQPVCFLVHFQSLLMDVLNTWL